LSSKVYEEIERVADAIQKVQGTIGVVLFGSYSRGDYEEGSDVDLLVLFKDKTALCKGSKNVYKATAKSDLFLQAICLTFNELCDSRLLESVRRDGKIYYANEDVKKLLASQHKPYALITYSTANLNPKERVVFIQKLEGRGKGKYRYEGLIQQLGGYKVGRGVIMIPMENLKIITEHLDKKGIDYVIRYVWT
jgi:predicted nucleotidyltransferase